MKKGLFHIIIIIVCLLLVDCGTHKKALHSQKRTDNISNKEQIKDIEYQGTPWVTNASKPINITKGLQNKHLSLWASHGKYYNQKKMNGLGKGLNYFAQQKTCLHKPL